MMRRVGIGLVVVGAAFALAGCSAAVNPGSSGASPASDAAQVGTAQVGTAQVNTASVDAGEYTAGGMLHVKDGRVQLCAGVAQSYPPQCAGGVDVRGWEDTGAVALETASGVTWGDAILTGTYVDGALVLTREPEPFVPTEAPLVDAVSPELGGEPLGEAELIAIVEQIVKEVGEEDRWSTVLTVGPDPRGWVGVGVVLDEDGSIQAEFDQEYGDGVVQVWSWLREAE